MKNNIYVGIETIVSKMSSLYKSVEITKSQILEWAAYAQMTELGVANEFFYFKDVKLVIKDSMAEMPCNVFRLLDVFDSNLERVQFRIDGDKFYFDSYDVSDTDDVYINYYGLPVTEEGKPMFIRGHEVALAYYCLRNYFEEKYVLGEMDANRFGYIQQRYDDEVEKARSSMKMLTKGKIEEMIQIIGNVAPKLGYVPIYNLE